MDKTWGTVKKEPLYAGGSFIIIVFINFPPKAFGFPPKVCE